VFKTALLSVKGPPFAATEYGGWFGSRGCLHVVAEGKAARCSYRDRSHSQPLHWLAYPDFDKDKDAEGQSVSQHWYCVWTVPALSYRPKCILSHVFRPFKQTHGQCLIRRDNDKTFYGNIVIFAGETGDFKKTQAEQSVPFECGSHLPAKGKRKR